MLKRSLILVDVIWMVTNLVIRMELGIPNLISLSLFFLFWSNFYPMDWIWIAPIISLAWGMTKVIRTLICQLDGWSMFHCSSSFYNGLGSIFWILLGGWVPHSLLSLLSSTEFPPFFFAWNCQSEDEWVRSINAFPPSTKHIFFFWHTSAWSLPWPRHSISTVHVYN